jgi:tRNA (adenine58-N1)-methyltransferase non-catalytic subunit
VIGLGKFGSFPANSLLGRPYYLTWNILDGPEGWGLELVPIEEINREKIATHGVPTVDSNNVGDIGEGGNGAVDSPGLAIEGTALAVEVNDDGEEDIELDATALQLELEKEQKEWEKDMKNNRLIRDDQTAQSMTWQEIERLKKSGGTGSGKVLQLVTCCFQSPHLLHSHKHCYRGWDSTVIANL